MSNWTATIEDGGKTFFRNVGDSLAIQTTEHYGKFGSSRENLMSVSE
jgi:hypothetical protein